MLVIGWGLALFPPPHPGADVLLKAGMICPRRKGLRGHLKVVVRLLRWVEVEKYMPPSCLWGSPIQAFPLPLAERVAEINLGAWVYKGNKTGLQNTLTSLNTKAMGASTPVVELPTGYPQRRQKTALYLVHTVGDTLLSFIRKFIEIKCWHLFQVNSILRHLPEKIK